MNVKLYYHLIKVTMGPVEYIRSIGKTSFNYGNILHIIKLGECELLQLSKLAFKRYFMNIKSICIYQTVVILGSINLVGCSVVRLLH